VCQQKTKTPNMLLHLFLHKKKKNTHLFIQILYLYPSNIKKLFLQINLNIK